MPMDDIPELIRFDAKMLESVQHLRPDPEIGLSDASGQLYR